MTKNEPASWKGRRAGRLQPAAPELKMLRPVCDACTDGDNVPQDWYTDCQHDPYVTVVERQEPPIPKYETDDEGTIRIVGYEDPVVTRTARPNWVGVTVARGLNSGRGVSKARRKGFILPQELRDPLYPNGIKPRCEFRDCYAEDIKEMKVGWFCREVEAALVYMAEGTGRVFEVFNAETQADQIAAAKAKAV